MMSVNLTIGHRPVEPVNPTGPHHPVGWVKPTAAHLPTTSVNPTAAWPFGGRRCQGIAGCDGGILRHHKQRKQEERKNDCAQQVTPSDKW
jgi:hypothetical protein